MEDKAHCQLPPVTQFHAGELPPPEPPPACDVGFLWELEPWWYYTILEPSGETSDDPIDDYEEVEVSSGLPDTYWTQLVSKFVDTHNPAACLQLVFGIFNHSVDDKKVTVNRARGMAPRVAPIIFSACSSYYNFFAWTIYILIFFIRLQPMVLCVLVVQWS